MKQRPDSIGMFWEDIPEVKIKKEVIKRTPPERTWESDDYLPHYDLALAYHYELFTDRELVLAMVDNDVLVLDTECYPNYFLISMLQPGNGKRLIFELCEGKQIPYQKLKWVLENFTIVTYNGRQYDFVLLSACLKQFGTGMLKEISDVIIKTGMRADEVHKQYKLPQIKCKQHIDLIELAPLRCSLKLLAARLHSHILQDLPFNPDKRLTPEQIVVTKWYCALDLQHTYEFLLTKQKELVLRKNISESYNISVMSASDQQIAEVMLMSQMRKGGRRTSSPSIEAGRVYKYQPPRYLNFQTPVLRNLFELILSLDFTVDELGKIPVPPEWTKEFRSVGVGAATYKLGIGGLHSSEENQCFFSTPDHTLMDWDVKSYYPFIVINNGYYPEHLGPDFLRAYTGIVERRLRALQQGNKTEADSLKITINGTFGKFASPYSNLYSPNLLMQVTLTGQLSLLMLIEQLELVGIKVVSANTDGVTAHIPVNLIPKARQIVMWWQHITGFTTEETPYLALFNRDVNNYIAFKKQGGLKTKGVFVTGDINKNPSADIIIDSVVNYLTKGHDPYNTLTSCRDIRKFLFVRTVKGGAVKNGEYLGKVVRWYYSTEAEGEIVYASTGNKVPKSDNSRPLLVLPHTFPSDIYYERYFEEIKAYFELWKL